MTKLEGIIRLPDVVHIGLPKCASTFLQEYFHFHPNISCEFKTGIFVPFDDCQYDLGRDAYRGLFSKASSTDVRIETDEHILQPLFHPTLGIRASTIQSWDVVLSRISALIPNAKIIVVVRNQMDMLLSSYSEYLLGAGTMTCDQYVKEFLSASSDGNNYFENDYVNLLDQLRLKFKDRHLVLLQEDLRKDETAILRVICDFLGVETIAFRGTFRSKRIGLSACGLRLVRKLNLMLVRYRTGGYRPALRISSGVYRAMCNALRIVDHYLLPRFLKGNRSDLVNPETRDFVTNAFKESNSEFMSMLDRKLDEYHFTNG